MFKPPPPRFGAAGGGSFSGASNGAVMSNQFGPGRMVRVAGGQYNGYRGRVKHETGTHVQLELDAISGRIVTVDKKLVRLEGPGGVAAGGLQRPGARGGYYGGAEQERDAYGGRGSSGAMPYGSRTPLHPSQTPLHPSMTPAHYSMTPSHAPYTPMHASTPGMMDDSYMSGGGGMGVRGTDPCVCVCVMPWLLVCEQQLFFELVVDARKAVCSKRMLTRPPTCLPATACCVLPAGRSRSGCGAHTQRVHTRHCEYTWPAQRAYACHGPRGCWASRTSRSALVHVHVDAIMCSGVPRWWSASICLLAGCPSGLPFLIASGVCV